MNIILEGRVGSHAYGLSTPTSDEDFLGIYAAPTEQFWTIDNKPKESVVTKDPDRTMHEAEKYARLALSCNPTALELLWLPTHVESTVEGWELLQIRKAFIGRDKLRSAYLGYAQAQLDRITQPRNVDLVNKTRAKLGREPESEEEMLARRAKNARHLARLLWQCTVFDITGDLPIQVENPQWFMAVGEEAARGDKGRLDQLWLNATAQFNGHRTSLPSEPNKHLINMWLLRTRLAMCAGAGLP